MAAEVLSGGKDSICIRVSNLHVLYPGGKIPSRENRRRHASVSQISMARKHAHELEERRKVLGREKECPCFRNLHG